MNIDYRMTRAEITKQKNIFKKYNITDYKIENNKITVYPPISLRYINYLPKDIFKGCDIKGNLCLDSLKFVHKDFLKESNLYGKIHLISAKYLHQDFYNKVLDKLYVTDRPKIINDIQYKILEYNRVSIT